MLSKMKVMLAAIAASVVVSGAVGADSPRYLEEKDGEIYLGTALPDSATDYAFTARAEDAKLVVDMEVRGGRLHHFAVLQDKRKWERRTFVFKESVVEGIAWAQKTWPDPEHIGTRTENGLVHVCTDLAVLRCVYSRKMDERIDFEIKVDGRPLAVHDAFTGFQLGWYNFATFDADKEVSIEVRCKSRDLRGADILPLKKGYRKQVVDDRTIVIKARPPFQLAVEPDGRNAPLFIFGNTPDRNVPVADDPKVLYFAPGVHEVGAVRPKSGQTVYLADGAVVQGSIEILDATNVTVRGRGIVCQNHLTRFSDHGPIEIRNSANVHVEGVILRGAVNWTFVLRNCMDVTVDNLKICCARMINDDGIDICNTSKVSVRNSFIYATDDSFATKGMVKGSTLPSDHLLVENCVLWTETANIFRVGYECDAPSFGHYVARDLYILHMDIGCGDKPVGAMWSDSFITLESANGALIHDHLYENIYIDDPRTNVYVAAFRADVFRPECDNGVGGPIRNVRLRNIVPTRAPAGAFGRYSAVVVKPDGSIENVFVENSPPPAEYRIDPTATKNIDFFGGQK